MPRGALRRELIAHLRQGRLLRRSKHQTPDGRGQLADRPPLAKRPAEVEDRAVPGHWEGDLILGAGNRLAIGTLVERSSRLALLAHLPKKKQLALPPPSPAACVPCPPPSASP